MTPAFLWSWVPLVFAAVLAGLGIAISIRALFRDRSRGRRRCPKCWYEIAPSAGRKCSECGRETRTEPALLKTRRHWWKAVLGCVLVLAAGASVAVQRVHEKGWLGAVPTAGYIALLPWMESGAALQEVEARVESGTMRQWEYRWLVRRSIRRLQQKNDTQKTLDLVSLLTRIEIGGRNIRISKPYGSWALASAIDGNGAVGAIVHLLDDEDSEVQLAAVRSVAQFTNAGTDAIPEMLAHLATADGGLRAEIGRYSSFFDMNSHDALHCPLMFGAGMTDGLPPVTRREFFTSLAGTGVDTQRAAPILLNGLGSDDPWIRAVCVWALGRCSLDGMEVRQRILALHNDPDEQVRRAVVEYTSRLDLDERVVAITTDALGDASANVQYGALAAAEWRGSSGGVFVGMIGPMIEHAKNDFDARLAAVAFVKVGGDPSVAIPTILRMLKSTRSERPAYSRGSEVDRTMSLEAVLAVAPLLQARAPELLGEVSTLMSDSVPSVRAIAAQAFACLGGDEERATRVVLDAVVAESAGGVPGGRAWNAMFGLTRSGHLSVSVMAEWLDSEKAGRRAEAARQLGDAGARSVSALPRLRELRHDPIAQVAEWADDAVKRIEWEIENPDEASRLRAEQVR